MRLFTYIKYYLTRIEEYIRNLPVTAFIVGILILVAVVVFLTWKFTMTRVRKKYEVEVFGTDYKTRVKKMEKTEKSQNTDKEYQKELQLRYYEVVLWKYMYSIYKEKLVTLGIDPDFNQNRYGVHEAEDELQVYVEIVNERGEVHPQYFLAKVDEASVSVREGNKKSNEDTNEIRRGF